MNTFYFNGFDAPKTLRDLAAARIASLVKSAPGVVSYEAYMVITRGGVYEGAVKIHSSVGTFKASAKGTDPRLVLQELYRRIKGQILEWTLRHPSLIYLFRKNPSGSRANGNGGSGCPAPAALAG